MRTLLLISLKTKLCEKLLPERWEERNWRLATDRLNAVVCKGASKFFYGKQAKFWETKKLARSIFWLVTIFNRWVFLSRAMPVFGAPLGIQNINSRSQIQLHHVLHLARFNACILEDAGEGGSWVSTWFGERVTLVTIAVTKNRRVQVRLPWLRVPSEPSLHRWHTCLSPSQCIFDARKSTGGLWKFHKGRNDLFLKCVLFYIYIIRVITLTLHYLFYFKFFALRTLIACYWPNLLFIITFRSQNNHRTNARLPPFLTYPTCRSDHGISVFPHHRK